MKRTEAWKDGLRRIEAGERAHRGSKEPEAPSTILIAARFIGAMLSGFASVLEEEGYHATAVEIRGFTYDVIEPLAEEQCQ